MKVLKIDTADRDVIRLKLIIDENVFSFEKKLESHKTQILLPIIVDFLHAHDISVQSISAIEVNEGPGSFTGLRVGVAIANTLSFVLGIPVNKKVFTNGPLVTPVYS